MCGSCSATSNSPIHQFRRSSWGERRCWSVSIIDFDKVSLLGDHHLENNHESRTATAKRRCQVNKTFDSFAEVASALRGQGTLEARIERLLQNILAWDSWLCTSTNSTPGRKSTNEFCGFFSAGPFATDGTVPLLVVTEGAAIINCMLHVLYGMSSRIYCPDISTIAKTFTALVKYGFSLPENVPSTSEIFTDLVSHAADPNSDPLEVYVIAASHSFEELAVVCSFYALRMPLSDIDQKSAVDMGPAYLLRLSRLHEYRKGELDKLLLVPPAMHEETSTCGREHMHSVMRAYSLTAAYLAWEAKADATTEWISGFFDRVITNAGCSLCRENVRRRVQDVIQGWSRLRRTI
ncbi:uncharacterized protein EI90DRAFT_3219217 [Cantharellus anzutake]|uniref:uncharacterized protein n=1 Tax=Cantharellus anzutake TaxID=1750568 RepID=UPI00190576C4|nr:uncharacterized protein EI90DRAFT_3219217 [Cantharellus anzutake]KAF8327899.1 hypothetical protein EI90DRAFT_3219217 [Cantharellus anzutake]